MSGVPLAAAIRKLRSELLEARQQGEDSDLKFELGNIELELQLEVSQEGKGDAGIRFWLVSVGGSASATRASTHTVRLTLIPQTAKGEKARVSR